MDVTNNNENDKKHKKTKPKRKNAFSHWKETLILMLKRRKSDPLAVGLDLSVFLISIIFARCHLLFGAYPLAPAFIAVLPSRVWISVFGSVLGALTLGKSGIIYSMIAFIVVFLRIIVSGGEKDEDEKKGEEKIFRSLFNENLLLRMSTALIGGFICSVYEILLSGFTLTSVAFSLSMILVPPILTFALSGLFNTGVDVGEIFKTDLPILSVENKKDKEKYNIVFFSLSACLLFFLISLSLAEYVFLGISLAYIFCAVVTLYTCRRFGGLRGGIAGFFSALGLSSAYSVSFGLSGIVSGFLFNVGLFGGIVGGVVTVALWCFYSGGVSGLLTVLPEYLISAVCMYPILKKVKAEKSETQIQSSEKTLQEMVDTMALAYKNRCQRGRENLVNTLMSLSSIMQSYTSFAMKPSREEICDLILSECQNYRRQLVLDFNTERNKNLTKSNGENSTESDTPPYLIEKNEKMNFIFESPKELLEPDEIDKLDDSAKEIYNRILSVDKINPNKIASLIVLNGKITEEDLENMQISAIPCDFFDGICLSVSKLCHEKYLDFKKDTSSLDIGLVGKLVNSCNLQQDEDKKVDMEVTKSCENALLDSSVSSFSIKVFGDRRKHLILAMEDESGETITSKLLRKNLENAIGSRLSTPDFFRREKMALMESNSTRGYTCECAISSVAGKSSEVSGDSAKAFMSDDDFFYSCICDGMGSGEVASEVSTFVVNYIETALNTVSCGTDTVLRLLNNAVRKGRDECSATVDLFTFDLIKGEGYFLKSGAAPSYVKRDNSIFRIRSKTAPLGLLGELDCEKVKVEIKSGDYIIMISDGVNQTGEDSTWFLELLGKEPKEDLKEYASFLLEEAKKHIEVKDDMTVSVTKITKIFDE